MRGRTLGLYCNPIEESCAAAGSVVPLLKYRRAVRLKANPRTEEYMRRLFAERFPGGEFVDAGRGGDGVGGLGGADTIVLLYPDAVGIGFRRLEAVARRQRRRGASIVVLNGRRRQFALDRRSLLRLRLRRLLERTMAAEFALLLPFLVLTAFYLVVDLSRGRR